MGGALIMTTQAMIKKSFYCAPDVWARAHQFVRPGRVHAHVVRIALRIGLDYLETHPDYEETEEES
jgi:hypothetical protein